MVGWDAGSLPVGSCGAQTVLPFFTTVALDEQAERTAKLAYHLPRIDPASAEAHFVAGALEMTGGWDWERAEREFDEAIRLDPSQFFYRWVRALLEVYLGDPANAAQMVVDAQGRSPGDGLIDGWTGVLLSYGGRFQETIEMLEP